MRRILMGNKELVWVLVIEHKYGFNHYAAKTKEGVMETLAEYCKEWWDDINPSAEIPLTIDEIIDVYFDNKYDEYYTYDLVEVRQ
jgi:hypothetical protein